MSISDRRADIVGILATALGSGHLVCDDIPDVNGRDVVIVVTWVGSRWRGVQWEHTYEVLIVPTHRTAPAFYTDRDAVTETVIATLDAAQGLDRPTATTRTVLLGDTPHAGAAVVTTTATDQPIST